MAKKRLSEYKDIPKLTKAQKKEFDKIIKSRKAFIEELARDYYAKVPSKKTGKRPGKFTKKDKERALKFLENNVASYMMENEELSLKTVLDTVRYKATLFNSPETVGKRNWLEYIEDFGVNIKESSLEYGVIDSNTNEMGYYISAGIFTGWATLLERDGNDSQGLTLYNMETGQKIKISNYSAEAKDKFKKELRREYVRRKSAERRAKLKSNN